jgi:hemoglobin-like flavoprotein
MTPRDIELVQQSYAKVAPIADQAAAMFYARLFELDPSLKSLFRGDMAEQGKRLMEMIAAAVHDLDDLDSLVPVVQDLGRRHVRYGVTADHYDTVGRALLDTLEKGLAEAFTDDVRRAWTTVYGVLSTTMVAATRDAPAPRASEAVA